MGYVWLNEDLVSASQARISVDDRGFLLGDGIFTTIKAQTGQLHFFSQHYGRLHAAAQGLLLPWSYQPAVLHHYCMQLLEQNQLMAQTACVRISVSRGLGGRGLSAAAMLPTLLISATPYNQPEAPMTAWISTVVRYPGALTVQYKTLNYLEPVIARIQANKQGFDEGLLVTAEGYITEASSANLFFIIQGALCTPPLSMGVFPGITRAILLRLAEQHGIAVRQIPISCSDALRATAIWQTNSLLGLQPLARINDTPLSTLAPEQIARLQREYATLT